MTSEWAVFGQRGLPSCGGHSCTMDYVDLALHAFYLVIPMAWMVCIIYSLHTPPPIHCHGDHHMDSKD
jgi:hypothetical protein